MEEEGNARAGAHVVGYGEGNGFSNGSEATWHPDDASAASVAALIFGEDVDSYAPAASIRDTAAAAHLHDGAAAAGDGHVRGSAASHQPAMATCRASADGDSTEARTTLTMMDAPRRGGRARSSTAHTRPGGAGPHGRSGKGANSRPSAESTLAHCMQSCSCSTPHWQALGELPYEASEAPRGSIRCGGESPGAKGRSCVTGGQRSAGRGWEVVRAAVRNLKAAQLRAASASSARAAALATGQPLPDELNEAHGVGGAMLASAHANSSGRQEGRSSRQSMHAIALAARRQHLSRRGALLKVAGLPPSQAKEALMALMAARGVPSRLALVQLGHQGRPAGEAYVLVEKVRDARRIVGQHPQRATDHQAASKPATGACSSSGGTSGGTARGTALVVVTLSTAEDLQSERQEFLCVQRAAEDGASSCASTRAGPMCLAETLHEGARVTGSMAAAIVSELLFGAPGLALED